MDVPEYWTKENNPKEFVDQCLQSHVLTVCRFRSDKSYLQNQGTTMGKNGSKAILLLGFYLFYTLESIFVLFEPYARFHI